MNRLIFSFLSLLIIFEATAQNSGRKLEKEIQPPEKATNPVRIVYPSEDTNQNRRPGHVSNEVKALNFVPYR